MKKNLFISFLSCSVFIFSQEYHFDYALQYDLENNGEKNSREFVVNSQQQRYEMSISKSRKEGFAELTDYENHVKHFYALQSGRFPLKSQNFIYQYSIRFPSILKQIAAEDSRRFFTTTLAENSEDAILYNISEFYNPKKSRKRADYFVKMRRFDADLSAFGLTYLLDYRNAGKKIKFAENYILEDGAGNFNGNSFSIQLKYIEPQNLDLVIEKPIYR